nr:DUF3300 domain-containing protein [Burkholderia cepacia]
MTLGIAPATSLAQAQAHLSNPQLDALTAPVALYPDALLAQVLMAATFPQQVQAAATWSASHASMTGDNAVKAVASEVWDPSVQSLVAFPQVLAMMASKPDWVTQLGDAFLAQPNDVMDSAQRLRRAAQQAGYLASNSQQKIIVEQSTIQVQPANPQVLYVPTYNPTVVYGAWPYPAYPPVYVPPPPGFSFANGLAAGIGFGVGIAITNSLWGGFDWNHHNVNINVSHYNSINVNHRINVTSNTAHWDRRATYTSRHIDTDRRERDAYLNRDESRTHARQTLESRTGQPMTGSAHERVDEIHHGGRERSGSVESRQDRSDTHQPARELNSDGPLRGAGDGMTSRAEIQRGQSSRQTASSAGVSRPFRTDTMSPHQRLGETRSFGRLH